MGVAEQEDGGLLVSTACLEVLPVYLKAIIAATESQHTLADLAAVVADGGEEAVVVRTEDDDLFTGHRQGFDGTRHGR